MRFETLVDECVSKSSYETTFSSEKFKVKLSTNVEDYCCWANYYLTPYFNVEKRSDKVDFTVFSLSGHTRLLESLRRQYGRKVIGGQGWAIRSKDKSEIHIIDTADGDICLSNPSGKTIILLISPDNRTNVLGAGKYETSRVIRDVFAKNLEERGYTVFHSGGVMVEDFGGFMIVGEKGSGKTSLISGFLSSLHGNLVGNDKLYIGSDNEFEMIGVPMTIRIGIGTLLCHDDLKRYLYRREALKFPQPEFDLRRDWRRMSIEQLWRCNTELIFSPKEFAKAFSTSIIPKSKISTILFSNLSPLAPASKIQKLNKKEAYQRLIGASLIHDPSYPDCYHLRTRGVRVLDSVGRHCSWEMCSTLPCFEVRGGSNVKELMDVLRRSLPF